MPDMQKVEMEYTLKVNSAEVSFICNALRGRGTGGEPREEWLDLAEKLIRQQRGWFDRQSKFLTEVLEKFLAEPRRNVRSVDPEDDDVELTPAEVATEVEHFLHEEIGVVRGQREAEEVSHDAD